MNSSVTVLGMRLGWVFAVSVEMNPDPTHLCLEGSEE